MIDGYRFHGSPRRGKLQSCYEACWNGFEYKYDIEKGNDFWFDVASRIRIVLIEYQKYGVEISPPLRSFWSTKHLLTRRMKVSVATLDSWLHGTAKPSLENLTKFCLETQCDLNWLIYGVSAFPSEVEGV